MRNKKESGEVVVEASIIVTLVFIVLSIMFYIGMVMYQQTAISTVANRTATNISQVYSNTLRDPFTGYIDPDNAYQSITYSSMKTDAYMDSLKQKGTAFVQYRLKKSQIIPTDDREVDVQIVSKPNELLKAQIVVSITDTYDVPLAGFFGVDTKLTFSATGRADCVDYLEYLSGIEAMSNPDEFPVDVIVPDVNIVTFYRDKYSGEFHASVPVLEGKSMISSYQETRSSMPDDPQFNGMRFLGWVDEDGNPFSASLPISANKEVYGNWECTITFNYENGSASTTKTVEYKKATDLPWPTKTGYDFGGWFTEKNGAGTEYTSESEIPGNIDLYAHWICNHENAMVKGAKTYTAKNCQENSQYEYNCSRCNNHKEIWPGEAGPHIEGSEWTIIASAKCETDGKKGKICILEDCSYIIKEEGIAATGHNWGRCGKAHDFRTNNKKEYYYIKNHAEGYRSVEAECLICVNCRLPAPTRGKGYPNKSGEWKTRLGQKVSDGMICRKHIAGGTEHSDGSQYNDMPNLHIHCTKGNCLDKGSCPKNE